ncbi:MAG: helix-turn-helix domain-containing protein [Bacteroidales bacterium]|nr:helix-turn-helix domain-containing protein [Bacteroidales bacterium]
MLEHRIPFRFSRLSPSCDDPFYPNRIISSMDECGVFLCTNGEVQVTLEKEIHRIRRGDMYIYMPSLPIRLLYKSEDAEGLLVALDVDFMLPVVQRVANAENLLHVRRYPFFSLTEENFGYIRSMLEKLWERIYEEDKDRKGFLQQRLQVELIKSMAQTITYEVLSIYFSKLPIQPMVQTKKDLIFHQFLLSLFRHFRQEREVAFYAELQHLSPRYFSSIIKEKSGNNALQWIVQMVITEAKLLLETSDLSIKEISVQLNFPTQSFFGKYFKQYTGISPKEFRENVLKER